MTGTHTIAALATPPGMGAIAVVRLSGSEAVSIADSVFRSVRDKKLQDQPSHTVHLGHIYDGEVMVDEVLVSVFHGPHSYTGENVVEISCHGSTYIQQRLLQILMDKGAKIAEAGEFTLRAFLNGKMDLSKTIQIPYYILFYYDRLLVSHFAEGVGSHFATGYLYSVYIYYLSVYDYYFLLAEIFSQYQ